jgi:hypothetical protein
MKKINTSTFAVGVIALMAIAAAAWITYTKDAKTELKELEKSVNGISAVGVQYDVDEIFLTVHAEKDLTCAEVFQILDIGPIIVKDRTYLPMCNIINGKLIEIVYRVKADV